jgi:hypothetical protein
MALQKTKPTRQKIKPSWKHYRAIHSRFPPKNLFDNFSDNNAKTQTLLAELESLTSDRLHRWREFVTEEDYRQGDGWGAVMASFCYVRAGRFNTESFGAYYCADSAHAAIAEWSFHAAKVWSDFGFTDEASAVLRCYSGSFTKALVDLTGDAKAHSKRSYKHSQTLASALTANNEYGVLYRSVRLPEAFAAALFRPPASSVVKQAGHYSVQWNGTAFIAFAKVSEYEKL